MVILQNGSTAIDVLIIEDNKLMRLGLNSLLQEDPEIHVIANAEDAETGLSLVQAHEPSVVLMDLFLPHMSGIEATEAIKKAAPQTKVIIYSAHCDEDEIMASLGSGADGFCTKDYDSSQLPEIIKSVYNGNCWLDPKVAAKALEVIHRPNMEDDAMEDYARQSNPNTQLTTQELAILKHIVAGKNNGQIAALLEMSETAAKAHISAILRKFSVKDRVQAAVVAVKRNII